MPYRLFVVVLALSSGCALVRTPITDFDGGADLPDVPGLDVPGLDAPLPDVPGLDAPLPEDVPLDVPALDAGMCAAGDTTCDRVDDDCDGVVDDSGACSLGGACTAFMAGGIAYQSCPLTTGMEAWAGTCRRMGPGYDLAVFSSGTQQDGVRSELARLGLNDPHWIGVNDFATSGTYVWRDRRAGLAPFFDGSTDDPAKRCVVFRTTGSYEELPCSDTRRVLCAADPDVVCGGREEGDACNGVDEDCDGQVDEGIDCGGRSCTSNTFWDHVYYTCTDDRNASEAAGDCDREMGGARLVTLDHGTEHTFVGGITGADALFALRQAAEQSGPAVGWTWPDTVVEYGTPAMVGVYPWGSGEPNDRNNNENNEENCGVLRGDDAFDDRPCGDRSDFLCERTWSY